MNKPVEKSKGLVLEIQVQPRSSKSCIVGLFDGRLKIKIKSPPVDNAANNECLKLLAKQLGLPKSRLVLISGQTGRRKKVLVSWPPGGRNSSDADRLRQAVKTLFSGSA